MGLYKFKMGCGCEITVTNPWLNDDQLAAQMHDHGVHETIWEDCKKKGENDEEADVSRR